MIEAFFYSAPKHLPTEWSRSTAVIRLHKFQHFPCAFWCCCPSCQELAELSLWPKECVLPSPVPPKKGGFFCDLASISGAHMPQKPKYPVLPAWKHFPRNLNTHKCHEITQSSRRGHALSGQPTAHWGKAAHKDKWSVPFSCRATSQHSQNLEIFQQHPVGYTNDRWLNTASGSLLTKVCSGLYCSLFSPQKQ